MTCKDCIHVYVCKNAFCWIDPNDSNKKTTCVHFKPKSRYIELPCAVGDTVYRVVTLLNKEIKIVKGIVLEFSRTHEGVNNDKDRFYFCAEGETFIRRQYSIWCESTDFGKTVFLTKEEAEKALAERSEGK